MAPGKGCTERSVSLLSLHHGFAPQNRQAAYLAFTVVLQRKGRVLETMMEAMAALYRRLHQRDYASFPAVSTGAWPYDPRQVKIAKSRQEIVEREAQEDQLLLEALRTAQARLAHHVLRGGDAAEAVQHEAELARLAREEQGLRKKIGQRWTTAKQWEVAAQLQHMRAEEEAKHGVWSAEDGQQLPADVRQELAQKSKVQIAALLLPSRADVRSQVQRAIPAGMALVELAVYRPFTPMAATPAASWQPSRYAAYVLHPQGEPATVDLGEVEAIDYNIAALRRALSAPHSPDLKRAARRLDEQVMRPLRAHLGSVQMVLLSPDGALNVVPFGALIDEHDQYLLEHFTFIYLSTGRDLLRLQVQGSPRQPPMIITDPDFGSVGAVGGFTPLPGTIAEARAIQSLLPEALVLSGTQATEAALKHVRGPRILHLATHGFFLHALPGVSRASQSATSQPQVRLCRLQRVSSAYRVVRIRCCVRDWFWRV